MKLRNWAFALAVTIFVAGAVTIEAQGGGFGIFESTTATVHFQGRSSRGLPAFVGQGSAFPTVAVTGLQPFNGELFNLVTGPDDFPQLSQYRTNTSEWAQVLTTGIVGAAHSTDDPVLGASGVGPETVHGITLKKFWFMGGPGVTTDPSAAAAQGTCSTTGGNWFTYDGVSNGFDMKGTQTECAATWTTNVGVIFHTDSTANDGYEVVWGGDGITAGDNPWSFTTGTEAFYARIRFDLPAITDTDELWFGFRNAGAYQDAAITSYDTYAFIGFTDAAGDYATITELGGSNATETDLSQTNASNGDQITLDVLVDVNGRVTYQINGSTDSSAVAFQFTGDEPVFPILWEQNIGSATAGALEVIYFELGYGVPID